MFLSPATIAQDDGKDSAGPTLYADFGFAGKIPAERWSPITLWVDPGDKALGGTVVTEFDQDATQSARIVTPFAATPGAQTPVQIVAALPQMADRVTFTLLDERGRRIQRLEYRSFGGADAATLPGTLAPEDGLLVCVGRMSLPEAVRAWVDPLIPVGERPSAPWPVSGPPTPEDVRRAWLNAHAATIEPAAMPMSWVAYDGATVLIVQADAALDGDPRAIDAVRTWVQAGGRLLILAHEPGPAWRRWLPDGPRGDLLELAAPTEASLPEECAEAMRAEAERDQTDFLPGEQDPDRKPPPAVPAPARTVTIRPITLSEAAAPEGWRARWTGDRGPALAEGPVGLGWVTVLTLEPRTAPSLLSARACGAVWRDALQTAAGHWLDGTPRTRGPWASNTTETADATVGLLSQIASLPGVGDGIFFAIGACMLGLALLVGPVDSFVLRRLGARQRSWLTALGWIALASGAAYAAPDLLRSGPTQVFRVTMIDRLLPRPGEEPLPAEQTGLTGIFAAESGVARFAAPDQSAWWRGVSTIDRYSAPGRVFGNITTVQDAAGGTLGASRGNPLERVTLGLWTFRTFLDRSRLSRTPIATVDRDGSDWVVVVDGLPANATLRNAALRLGGRWFELPDLPANARDHRLTWRVPDEAARTAVPDLWLRTGSVEWRPGATGDTGAGGPDRPGMAASLAGAFERSVAIDHRIATGCWAAVYLHAEGWPTDAGIDWASQVSQTAVLRLVVPLDDADRLPAVPITIVPRRDEFAAYPWQPNAPPVGAMGPPRPNATTPPSPPPSPPAAGDPAQTAPDTPPDQGPPGGAP